MLTFSCNNGSPTKGSGSDSLAALPNDSIAVQKAVQDSLNLVVAKLKADLAKADSANTVLKKQTIPKPALIDLNGPRQKWMDDIDWLSQHPEQPAQARCLFYVVGGGGAPKLRGNASAVECLRNSIQAYRTNNVNLALNWLCAGQCHNDDAQKNIRQGGVMACQYAYQKYGDRFP